jgi:hypothetical protein
MSDGPPPPCHSCRHFEGFNTDKKRFTCEAFPEGVPAVILDGYNPHRQPFEGDHGIQWEQAAVG